MSKILTDNKYYSQIADVIREQNGTSNTYKPQQIVSALKDLFYEEVEGVPPISFNGIGENLLDYRIDGASGGVGDRTNNLFDKKNTEIIHAYFSPENLWQVNEDSSSIIIKVQPNTQYTLSIGTAISIFRIYKTSLENPEPGKSNVFTPIIRSSNIKTYTFTTDNDITYIIFQGTNADTEMWINSLILNIGSTSLPSYEPYGYKVPVVVSGNNLAKWDTHLQPQTNGIVLNDTNSISSIINVSNINNIYIFGDRTKLNSNVYRIGKSNEPISLNSQTTRITFTGGILDTSDCNYVIVSCSIYNTETTFDDIKNSFMIVEGTTSPENFEPYIEPTTTNIYLDEPIEENESISLSDTNTNIPTIDGTNVLTINTTVQPSNVYIQAPKDTPKMVEARERLEVI